MVSYASKVKRDIERWVEAGIIGSDTGSKLAADVAQHHRGASLGAMLATMASALLAASILIFIAANWEVIPRLTRVAFLFLLILVGYVSGAILKLREHGTFGEVAWVLAAVSFGAAIALTSQMYHISGDETQALIMWCVGTGFAAAVLQSRYLTVLAALLAICWMTVPVSENASKATSLSLQYLGLGSTVYAISYWTRSRAARQILVVSLSLLGFLNFLHEPALAYPMVLGGGGVALFLLSVWKPVFVQRWLGLGSSGSVLGLLAFITAAGMAQLDYIDTDGFLFASAAVFIGLVGAMLLSGRDNRSLRWLVYLTFSAELAVVYLVMIGTMLGTAGFFLVGGLVLAALAWFISRFERQIRGDRYNEGGWAQ